MTGTWAIFFSDNFFYENEVPDYELFRSQARQYGFDEVEYLAAVDRVARWSRETVELAMTFYAKLAGMISTLSYSTVNLSRALSQQETALESLKMLRSSIPTTGEIREDIEEGLPNVLADPFQIQQIIMNLCTNAGQVMEAEGGTLTFTLDIADLETPLHTVVEVLLQQVHNSARI